MQDCPSSRSLKSNLAIGAFIGGGLFATALACGVVALGPLAIPIGLGAVLAGGAGGVLFPTIKSNIAKVVSDANIPKTYIQHNFGSVAFSRSRFESFLEGFRGSK